MRRRKLDVTYFVYWQVLAQIAQYMENALKDSVNATQDGRGRAVTVEVCSIAF